jgi:hypothetical protein
VKFRILKNGGSLIHECDAPELRIALEQLVIQQVSMHGADLHGANLYDADLHGADLHVANLRGANLHGANLRGADLGGANLHGADLRGANLHGANLRGADLGGANLYGADLYGARNKEHARGLPDDDDTLDSAIRAAKAATDALVVADVLMQIRKDRAGVKTALKLLRAFLGEQERPVS